MAARSARSSYTFTNVTGAHTIAATFAIDTFVLGVTAGANGTLHLADGGVRSLGAFTSRRREPPHRLRARGRRLGRCGRDLHVQQREGEPHDRRHLRDQHFTIAAWAGANGSIARRHRPSTPAVRRRSLSLRPRATTRVVLVDGVSRARSRSYTFSNVRRPHIAATFAIDTFSSRSSAGANGASPTRHRVPSATRGVHDHCRRRATTWPRCSSTVGPGRADVLHFSNVNAATRSRPPRDDPRHHRCLGRPERRSRLRP